MKKYLIPFLKSLLSNKTETDPKYFVGLTCTALWIVIVLYHLYSHFNVQSEIIFANITIIAAVFGLDVVNSVKAMSVKAGVASDMVKQDSSPKTNDQASDVLQSKQPS